MRRVTAPEAIRRAREGPPDRTARRRRDDSGAAASAGDGHAHVHGLSRRDGVQRRRRRKRGKRPGRVRQARGLRDGRDLKAERRPPARRSNCCSFTSSRYATSGSRDCVARAAHGSKSASQRRHRRRRVRPRERVVRGARLAPTPPGDSTAPAGAVRPSRRTRRPARCRGRRTADDSFAARRLGIDARVEQRRPAPASGSSGRWFASAASSGPRRPTLLYESPSTGSYAPVSTRTCHGFVFARAAQIQLADAPRRAAARSQLRETAPDRRRLRQPAA